MKAADDYKVKFGQHLQSIRKAKGLSLRDLEKISEMDNQNISAIEQGKKDVQLSTIIKLAAALHIAPKDLLDF